MKKPNKDLLKINLNRLEEECAGQSQLMAEWGEILADAKRKSKDLRKALKLLTAQISLNVRRDPAEFGLARATDDSVKEVVTTQDEVQNLQDQVIQAEYEEEILDSFVWSIVDRKAQLENLVKLHGQMYWSKPDTSSEETSQSRIAAMQTANKSLGKKK